MANVLDLTIDATGMERGAQQAQQALNKVTQSVKLTDQALNKAFQTTGGSIQVAGGISQTAKALADLNAAAAASSAARTLLEIGRTAQDFRELSQNLQQTTTTYDLYGNKITTAAAATSRFQSVMSTLGAVIRANPLLAIATAIGAISTAMALFADNTKKAADSFDRLGETMSKARMDASTAAYLGVPGPGNQGTLQALFDAISSTRASGQGMNLRDFGRIGYGARAAKQLIASGTPEQREAALEYVRRGGSTVQLGYGMETVSQFRPGELPSLALSQEQTQSLLRDIYRSIPQAGATTTPSTQSSGDRYGIGSALNMSMQAAQIAAYKKQEADDAKRVAENMARAADYAANIGATVGSAFADVLMKTTTLRQAFASIVASIARQGLSDVGAAIFRGAVSGLTPTQAGGNAGLTAPGTTPRN